MTEQAYFFAWFFNILVPLFFTTAIVLIVYPPSRSYLFPPAPLALVDSKTGGVQSPKAGVLGSHDSMTGAPEKHKGEAVEQEASNFVSSFASIALSSATGKHDQSNPGGDPIDSSVPDPTKMAMNAADAKSSTGGGSSPPHHDKTKQPMEEAMWTKTRPVMHIIGDIADGWERFAKYFFDGSLWRASTDMALKRSLSHSSLPKRDSTREACWATCSGCSHCTGYVVFHVYEDDDLFHRRWLFRRPNPIKGSRMAQPRIPQLAEAAGT